MLLSLITILSATLFRQVNAISVTKAVWDYKPDRLSADVTLTLTSDHGEDIKGEYTVTINDPNNIGALSNPGTLESGDTVTVTFENLGKVHEAQYNVEYTIVKVMKTNEGPAHIDDGPLDKVTFFIPSLTSIVVEGDVSDNEGTLSITGKDLNVEEHTLTFETYGGDSVEKTFTPSDATITNERVKVPVGTSTGLQFAHEYSITAKDATGKILCPTASIIFSDTASPAITALTQKAGYVAGAATGTLLVSGTKLGGTDQAPKVVNLVFWKKGAADKTGSVTIAFSAKADAPNAVECSVPVGTAANNFVAGETYQLKSAAFADDTPVTVSATIVDILFDKSGPVPPVFTIAVKCVGDPEDVKDGKKQTVTITMAHPELPAKPADEKTQTLKLDFKDEEKDKSYTIEAGNKKNTWTYATGGKSLDVAYTWHDFPITATTKTKVSINIDEWKQEAADVVFAGARSVTAFTAAFMALFALHLW
ncbi:hypothetical protein BLNAU_23195 [Blattamonas nauphoetae]|uniref:Uncharacterized protein n=1 Tax=Blattamonas nauphoetae TaxID=2049346 RepID=A0ABQ9WS28_9EUKA|nr:hypothetical protein BLNAU_23195 [Blattamonas nauphoetae]